MKIEFTQMSPAFQKRMIDLLKAKYVLKGSDNPDKDAAEYIKRKKTKTSRQWRRIRWFTMLSIDKHRSLIGLSKIYS